MVLAFKLYGEFCWPPVPSANPPSLRYEGVVEVHFDNERPFLHWHDKAADQGGRTVVTSPSDNTGLFDKTPAEAAALFGKPTQPVSVWLDGTPKPTSTPNKMTDWLVFRGGFLFEQYDAAQPLRWPLVGQCAYEPGFTVHSTLGLCWEKKKKKRVLYLNLNLPLPVRRSAAPGVNCDVRAFPITAAYDLAKPGTDFDRLFAGWSQDDRLPVELTNRAYEFADEDHLPKARKLGAFGFSEYKKSTSADFAAFNRSENETHYFWPENKRSLIQDVLWPYGFALKYNEFEWLDFSDDGAAMSSLRFLKPEPDTGGRHRGGMIYRTRVKAKKAYLPDDKNADHDLVGVALGADEDAPVELRLRLQDELNGLVVEDLYLKPPSLPSEIDHRLYVGKELCADCELSWSLSDDDIWRERETWFLRVTVRLHWDDVVPQKLNKPLESDGVFRAGLLAQAGHTLTETRDALYAGEAGLPHAFLPDLAQTGASTARFCLYGTPVTAHLAKDGKLTWGRPVPGTTATPWQRPPMRLSLADNDDLIAGEGAATAVTLTAQNGSIFRPAAGSGVSVSLELILAHDTSWPPRGAEAITDGDPFFASFHLTAKTKAAWRGRLASLRFAQPNLDKYTLADGHLRIGGRGTRLGTGRATPLHIYPGGRVAVELRLRLPVETIEPIGADVPRWDTSERPGPLLIPLDRRDGSKGNASKAGHPPFWLTATETLSPIHDRRLTCEIIEDTQGPGDQAYAVLSAQPFSLWRFTQAALADRGDAANAVVAVYSSDDRVWQYKRVSPYYHYTFPPQSIGESADKPRRLEIHDLQDGAPDPQRPHIDDLKRHAVEYKLTPSAEIWIRPSDVERGYFMPQSAGYDIFRQRGEYGLGAALAFLRAEYLYGLPVGIDVARESGVSRGARVAEIEALTGRPAGSAREAHADPDVSTRWDALRGALSRRVERLEVWARDLDSAVDFTPAAFADGVQFALRHTALHRAPLVSPAGTDTGTEENTNEKVEHPFYALLPYTGDAAERVAEPAAAPAGGGLPRYHPQGLSGGALWPVESLNLFKSLLNAPQSQGGVIEGIAITPLGGDASQKAAFLNNKVKIISDTRNGHVERHQVEVLGRICALWHRAKHVVVYERTVNATAQFAPLYDEDKDRTRSRRPIVRKVSEYIELLEPERSYPDFSLATARNAGFLERVRFNSRIIHVDSAWSSDVEGYGWQIPLWNRLAARQRPQVYAMPDIAFVSTAEGEGDNPVVAQACLDPDHLYFFADVQPQTTSDTNQWPARLDLDYANMPAATALADLVDAGSSAAPADDGRRRSVNRILPGLRRFTWCLAPSARKTAMNAGRSDKPLYVGVASASLMRASHAADEHKTLPHDLANILGREPVDVPAAIQALPYWNQGGGGASVSDKDLLELLASIHPGMKKADLDTLRRDIGTKFNTGAAALAKSLAGSATKDGLDLEEFGQKGPAYCEKLKSDAVGMIQRKEMLVLTALQDWKAKADKLLREYPDEDTLREAIIDKLTDEAVKYIKPVFDDAGRDIGKIDEGAEKALAMLTDLEGEIDAVFERAMRRADEFYKAYDRKKPWSRARLDAFRKGLEASVGNVTADIAAVVDETRQRLGVELNEVSQAVGGYISKALRQITGVEGYAVEELTRIESVIKQGFAGADQLFERLLSVDANGSITKLEVAVDGSSLSSLQKVAVKHALDAARSPCADARQAIEDARAKAQAIDNDAVELFEGLEKTIPKLAELLTTALRRANEALTALKSAGIEALTNGALEVVAALKATENDYLSWTKTFEALQIAQGLTNIDKYVDAVVMPVNRLLKARLDDLRPILKRIPQEAQGVVADARVALNAARAALAPGQLLDTVVKSQILRPAFAALALPLSETLKKGEVKNELSRLRQRLDLLSEEVSVRCRGLTISALDAVAGIGDVCSAVFEGVKEVRDYCEGLKGDAETYLKGKLDAARKTIDEKLKALDGAVNTEKVLELVRAAQAFEVSVRNVQNNLSRVYESADAYRGRVLDQASRVTDGGLMAAPTNLLKLYSAVTSAPEIAALQADIDRIRSGFDEMNDIIKTTRANALFNRLGDELKALGLSMPFDQISDRLLPNLKDLDIAKLFRNFGGANLSSLFDGYKVPEGLQNAIKITHDFDKKHARAWVQVDIDAPMSGRRSLFSIGVFKADFVDMRLTGQVRLEASKDQDNVTETGFGRIATALDLVVGGQSMVTFEKVGLNYSRESGMNVEFDPKSVRLNPAFKFVQDFLSTLFPDKVGCLTIIKDNGQPVGVQHDFALPPMALSFGTSGVSNISIENHFKLVAYPDFLLANRFNLSTAERPFIFSIFIIGGAGYIQIEAEYRPFDSELMVMVEAAVGGSAALTFACGPFMGQVVITLSAAMSYRKLIGRGGGGLAISAVLVIAGRVDVCGIASATIVLMLRLTYREGGAVDGIGTVSVEIRISRFFTLSARANANYRLRNGQSETTTSGSVEGKPSEDVQKKIDAVKTAADRLNQARR